MSTSVEGGPAEETPYLKAGVDILDLLSKPEYRGCVESLRDGVISGWCFSTADLMRPVRLELWLGETRLHSFLTSGARPDIEQVIGLPVWADFSTPLNVFGVPAPAELARALAPSRVDRKTAQDWLKIRVASQPVELEFVGNPPLSLEQLAAWLERPFVVSNSLDARLSTPSYRGLIEALVEGTITGWCVDIDCPDQAIRLEVYFDEVSFGVVTTSETRNDINSHLRTTALAGFRFGPEKLGASNAANVLSVLSQATAGGRIDTRRFKIRIAGTHFFLGVSDDVSIGPTDLARYCDVAASLLTDLAGNHRLDLLRTVMEQPKRIALPSSDAVAKVRDPQEVAIVAFYLPQFHPFAENDDWWGTGFTEWSNVTAARPSFGEHNQPRIPADLGYYDLRLDLIQEQQTALARKYKVSVFCYYYYFFSGKTLMTLPIERHFEKQYDLDFCLCWANENWSRRWDGSESEVLIRQSHSEVDDEAFIDQVIHYFTSPRYLKIDGAPLILVYRVDLLANPAATISFWKQRVRAAGFPDLHVCICETFGLDSPIAFAADSSCQFPPHDVVATDISNKVADLDEGFSGKIFDYTEMAANEIRRPDAPFLRFRSAMPGWDNTSRKGRAAHIFHNASPSVFEAWLSVLCAKARRNLPPGQRLVFVNAWNEWAEGAYLEPDRRYSHRNLRAVRAACSAANRLAGDALDAALAGDDSSAETVRLISSLANSNRRLLELISEHGGDDAASPFIAIAEGLFSRDSSEPGECHIERVDGRAVTNPEITLSASQKVSLSGWVRVARVELTASLPVFLQLAGAQGQDYVASLYQRFPRTDVAAAFNDNPDHHYGFNGAFDLGGVQPGVYKLQMLVGSVHHSDAVYLAPTALTFLVG